MGLLQMVMIIGMIHPLGCAMGVQKKQFSKGVCLKIDDRDERNMKQLDIDKDMLGDRWWDC